MKEKTREYNVQFNSLLVKESENREYYRSIMKEVNDVYSGITSEISRPLFLDRKLKPDLKNYLHIS